MVRGHHHQTVDILATVVAVAVPAEHVLDGLVGTPRGTAVRTRPAPNVHAQSHLAGAGAPAPAAARRLPDPDRGPLAGPSAEAVDELDREIRLAHSADGRLPLQRAGTDAGTSEATARRRLDKLTRLGTYRPMVEVAAAESGAPLTVW
ncbi:AsnC family protein [Streptomyces sp. NPDC085460]|uniref:AsnC family protein n=1 Tax=Streptomyces sp. NPDC085460 TaxID=3365723 RepID=UPI0037D621B3